MAALLKRDVVVMRWSGYGLMAGSGLVHAYYLLREHSSES